MIRRRRRRPRMIGQRLLLRALDEAMRGDAWERGDRARRGVLLARAVCRAFDGRTYLLPAEAAFAAALVRADRDRRIRALRRTGLGADVLAQRFGLSSRQIHRICGRDTGS